MGILNRPSDGLLSVFIALRRALIAFGPLPDDQLLALCAPPSAVDKEENMARKTLVRWQQLGFFASRAGRIHIADAYNSIALDDLESLRIAILRLILSPTNNELLGADSSADDDTTRAADFSRAASWFLSQDPYTFRPSWDTVDDLQTVQGSKPRVFTNSTRWNGLLEWATFVGIAWPAPSGTGGIPVPALAIRAVLDEVFGTATELPQDGFFAALADALPVVSGARYWRAMSGSVPSLPRVKRENHVAQSLSLALLQLDAAEEIRLDARADAPYRQLVGRGGRELRRVSHLIRVQER